MRTFVFAFAAVAGCASSTPLPPPPPAPALSSPPTKPTTMSKNAEPIVQTGAPVLRVRAGEVSPERIASKEIQDLVTKMVATMRAAPGVGLAAPQIGVPLRVFVLEDRAEYIAKITDAERQERLREPVPLRVFVNPVVTPVGAEKATFFEGCLSVSGYVGLVERSLEVEVNGLDEHGAPQKWRTRGWPARILQHELDHLDGKLYVDRMITRSFATADQARALYGGKPIAEVRKLLGD